LRDDCAPLALMGVRCFWPHNMIGHEGLVVDQAWKFAVVADEPSGVTSHPRRPPLLALARCDHARCCVTFSRSSRPSQGARRPRRVKVLGYEPVH
jgi:hypothetical protein